MLVNHSSLDPMQKEIDRINEENDDSGKIELAKMNGLNTQFAISNKWWGYIPVANILGKNYSNLELNLTRFSIPQMNMGSTTVAFKGYEYEFPTKLLDASEKTITLDYIIDEKWQNYRSLFKWCSATEGQINQVISTSDVEGIQMKDLLDVRIYLLDHFKNEIISFSFFNTWIKNFSDLELESNSTDEVHHQITLAYSNFQIDDVK